MEMAGGYRLVRKLGEGARSTVFLGRAVTDESTPATEAHSGSVAIKIFRPSTTAADIDAEIEALARASHRHLVELIDLALMPDGRPCLILRRLGNTSLATLLAGTAGRPLGPGEVVTALVPIARALAELHRVGIAHGNVCADSVLLDELGAPVLIGFGHAGVVGPVPVGSAGSLTPVRLGNDPRIRADIADFARLALRMLAAVGESDGPVGERGTMRQMARWLEQVLAAMDQDAAGHDSVDQDAAGQSAMDQNDMGQIAEGAELAAIADRLFELAPAAEIRSPIAAVSTGPPVPPAVRSAAVPLRPAVEALPARAWGIGIRSAAVPTPAVPRTPVAGLLSALDPTLELLRGVLSGIGDKHGGGIARARAKIVSIVAPVRRPVWIAGGIGVAALVCGFVVIPAVTSSKGTTTPVRVSTTAPSPDASATGRASAPGRSSAPPSQPATDGRAVLQPSTDAIAGDDPASAAAALARKRQGCLDSGSVRCLATVDQAGSAAEDADRQAVRDIRAADSRHDRTALLDGAAMIEASFVLQQSIGDTAILTVNRPTAGPGVPGPDASGPGGTRHGGAGPGGAGPGGAGPGASTTTASVLMIRTEAGWRFRDLLLGG
jgi:hypothetical protein